MFSSKCAMDFLPLIQFQPTKILSLHAALLRCIWKTEQPIQLCCDDKPTAVESETYSTVTWGIVASTWSQNKKCIQHNKLLINWTLCQEDIREWRCSSTIPGLGTSWRWVVSSTQRLLMPGGKGRHVHWIGGWVGPWTSLDALEKRTRLLEVLSFSTTF